LTQQAIAIRDSAQFAKILGEEEFRIELARLFPTTKGPRTAEEVRFQMLRLHPDRCVFDVSMKGDGGWQSVIAKIFADDRPDTFSTMEKIHQGGFGPSSEWAVPKPIAYLPSMRILLEEKIEGRQVENVLLSDNEPAQLEAIKRCGVWLASFHVRAPRFGNRVEPQTHLKHVKIWADKTSKFWPPFAEKCHLLIRRLSAALPAEGTFEYRPGHGNYIPEHVVMCGARTVTIDLDGFDLVDPARDIAMFLITLERMGLKHHKAPSYYDRLIRPFVESYLNEGDQNALQNLAFYKSAEYLHRARHDIHRRIPPAPEWAEMMLDQALRGL
jgi:hypothetical protein